MARLLKRLTANLFLSLASLLVCLLFLEFVVFKYFFIPDDVLPNVTIENVVRYQPNVNAVFRHPDRSRSVVRINQDGWNSAFSSYRLVKNPGVLRIAVVGDSYVHGAFVNVEQGFAHQLQKQMRENGLNTEVYRFGMDGAPLSQYLHMLRNSVVQFNPDIVIIPLIHNDFDEIYRMIGTRYNSSFLKIGRDAKGRIVEIPPRSFRPGMADFFRHFRTFRYLYYETGAYLHLKKYISGLFWGKKAEFQTEFISSAIDIRNIKGEEENIVFYTRYVLNRIKALAEARNFKLLFVMDGVREAVYDGQSASAYEVGKLNRIAAELCAQLNLPFIDLQESFAADFSKNRNRFEFPFDWHWNAAGNRIVADAIWQKLQSDKSRLLRPALMRKPRTAQHMRDDKRLVASSSTALPEK